MLVERIAEAPEVRVALASQGVGLLSDLGRQISRAASTVDDFVERTLRRLFRRRPRVEPTDHVGLVGRGVALATDAGILAAGFALFTAMLSGALQLITDEKIPAWLAALLSLAGFVTVAIYFVGFWAFEGQTPGMRFVGIQLEHEGTAEIGVRRAFRRLWATVLAVLPFGLGLLPIAFRDNRRGFQDRVVGDQHGQAAEPHPGAVVAESRPRRSGLRPARARRYPSGHGKRHSQRALAPAPGRSARLLRWRRPCRADGRARARPARRARLRPQGDRPQQACRRAAHRARRDLRRGGDRGPRGRSRRLQRPRRLARRSTRTPRSGTCVRSTRPARSSPRSTSRPGSSPRRATRSS